jgi:hypothetical protein
LCAREVPAQSEDEGYPMVEVPQSPERMVPICGRLFEAIVDAELAHVAEPELSAHVGAVVRRSGDRGWRLSKSGIRRNIDGCILLQPVQSPSV